MWRSAASGMIRPTPITGTAIDCFTQRRQPDVLVGLPRQRTVGEAHAEGVGRAGRHVHGVGAGGLGQHRVLGGQLRGDPALGVLAAVDAHDHREPVAAAGADGPDHVGHQPGPVLDRSAPLVGAGVEARREEGGDEVAVGGVHLDPVEPGGLHPGGSVGELVDDPRQVVGRGLALGGPLAAGEGGHLHQLVHGEGADVDVLVGHRHRGHELVAVLHGVDAGGLAVVADLHDHLRPVLVHRPAQALEPGHEPVVGERRLVDRRGADRPGHGRGLEDEQPDAALRPRLVVGHGEVGDLALVAGVLVHGRHDDAVAQRHGPDRAGREQVSVGHRSILRPDLTGRQKPGTLTRGRRGSPRWPRCRGGRRPR